MQQAGPCRARDERHDHRRVIQTATGPLKIAVPRQLTSSHFVSGEDWRKKDEPNRASLPVLGPAAKPAPFLQTAVATWLDQKKQGRGRASPCRHRRRSKGA